MVYTTAMETIETKICTKCEIEQPIDEFTFKIKATGRRQSWCRSCHKIARRKHYVANTAKEIQRSKVQKHVIIDWYKEYKKGLRCEECGEDHPATIQYHHKDSSMKLFEISSAVRAGRRIEVIKEEMLKCKILCANCHFKLHWEEKNAEY